MTYANLDNDELPTGGDEHESNGDGGSLEDGERRNRVAKAAGRLAFSPVRAAARAVRGPLEDVADEVLSAPEVSRLIDNMLAGELPEEFVESVVNHQVIERVTKELVDRGEIDRVVRTLIEQRVLDRVATQVAESGELERLVSAALASERTTRLAGDVMDNVLDRALAGPLPERIAQSVIRNRVPDRIVGELASSGEIQRMAQAALASPKTVELARDVLVSDVAHEVLHGIASSPELRDAITSQTTGLIDEVIGGIREVSARVDDKLEAAVRRRTRPERSPYAGIATRALALGVDILLTFAFFTVVVGMLSLVESLIGDLKPQWLVAALLVSGWALIAGSYFVLFWCTVGQTPGMRLFRLRVERTAGGRVGFLRANVRLIGIVLSFIPLCLGFVPVLFTTRRRGLADALAGTVVYGEGEGEAAADAA